MKTKVIYPVLLTKEDEDYLVEFPDLPGCITYGESLEHAIEMSEDVLGAYVITLMEEGQEIPKPSKARDIKYNKNQEVTYISSNIAQHISKVERVKKTLTIPKWLDEQAKKESINFSKSLERSLIKELSDEDYNTN